MDEFDERPVEEQDPPDPDTDPPDPDVDPPDPLDGPPIIAGGRRQPILETLRRLGTASAREVAQELDRTAGNVSTQLRQYEEAGRVRRTGRSVSEPGQRGGPSIEWELMPEGGTPTGPGVVLDGPGPVEERLRAMAERVGAANGRIEALEEELERERRRYAEKVAELAIGFEQGPVEDLRNREKALMCLARELWTEDVVFTVDDVVENREELAAMIAECRTAAVRAAEQNGHAPRPAREDLRERFFTVLLARVEGNLATEDELDRLERLIDGERAHGT